MGLDHRFGGDHPLSSGPANVPEPEELQQITESEPESVDTYEPPEMISSGIHEVFTQEDIDSAADDWQDIMDAQEPDPEPEYEPDPEPDPIPEPVETFIEDDIFFDQTASDEEYEEIIDAAIEAAIEEPVVIVPAPAIGPQESELPFIAPPDEIILPDSVTSESQEETETNVELATIALQTEKDLLIVETQNDNFEELVENIETVTASDVFRQEAVGSITSEQAATVLTEIKGNQEQEQHAAQVEALRPATEIQESLTTLIEMEGEGSSFFSTVNNHFTRHVESRTERGLVTDEAEATRLFETIRDQLAPQLKDQITHLVSSGNTSIINALDHGFTERELRDFGYTTEHYQNAVETRTIRDAVIISHQGNVIEALVKSEDVTEDNLIKLYSEETVAQIVNVSNFADSEGIVDPYAAIVTDSDNIAEDLKLFFNEDFIDTLGEVSEYIEVGEEGEESLVNAESYVRDSLEDGDLEVVEENLTKLGFSNASSYIESVQTIVKAEIATDVIEEAIGIEDLNNFEPDNKTRSSKIFTLYARTENSDSQVLVDYGYPEDISEGIIVVKDFIDTEGVLDSYGAALGGKTKEELEGAGITEADANSATQWGRVSRAIYADIGVRPENVTPLQAAKSQGIYGTSILFGDNIAWAAMHTVPHLTKDGTLLPQVAMANGLNSNHLITLGVPEERVRNLRTLSTYFNKDNREYDTALMWSDPEAREAILNLAPQDTDSLESAFKFGEARETFRLSFGIDSYSDDPGIDAPTDLSTATPIAFIHQGGDPQVLKDMTVDPETVDAIVTLNNFGTISREGSIDIRRSMDHNEAEPDKGIKAALRTLEVSWEDINKQEKRIEEAPLVRAAQSRLGLTDSSLPDEITGDVSTFNPTKYYLENGPEDFTIAKFKPEYVEALETLYNNDRIASDGSLLIGNLITLKDDFTTEWVPAAIPLENEEYQALTTLGVDVTEIPEYESYMHSLVKTEGVPDELSLITEYDSNGELVRSSQDMVLARLNIINNPGSNRETPDEVRERESGRGSLASISRTSIPDIASIANIKGVDNIINYFDWSGPQEVVDLGKRYFNYLRTQKERDKERREQIALLKAEGELALEDTRFISALSGDQTFTPNVATLWKSVTSDDKFDYEDYLPGMLPLDSRTPLGVRDQARIAASGEGIGTQAALMAAGAVMGMVDPLQIGSDVKEGWGAWEQEQELIDQRRAERIEALTSTELAEEERVKEEGLSRTEMMFSSAALSGIDSKGPSADVIRMIPGQEDYAPGRIEWFTKMMAVGMVPGVGTVQGVTAAIKAPEHISRSMAIGQAVGSTIMDLAFFLPLAKIRIRPSTIKNTGVTHISNRADDAIREFSKARDVLLKQGKDAPTLKFEEVSSYDHIREVNRVIDNLEDVEGLNILPDELVVSNNLDPMHVSNSINARKGIIDHLDSKVTVENLLDDVNSPKNISDKVKLEFEIDTNVPDPRLNSEDLNTVIQLLKEDKPESVQIEYWAVKESKDSAPAIKPEGTIKSKSPAAEIAELRRSANSIEELNIPSMKETIRANEQNPSGGIDRAQFLDESLNRLEEQVASKRSRADLLERGETPEDFSTIISEGDLLSSINRVTPTELKAYVDGIREALEEADITVVVKVKEGKAITADQVLTPDEIKFIPEQSKFDAAAEGFGTPPKDEVVKMPSEDDFFTRLDDQWEPEGTSDFNIQDIIGPGPSDGPTAFTGTSAVMERVGAEVQPQVSSAQLQQAMQQADNLGIQIKGTVTSPEDLNYYVQYTTETTATPVTLSFTDFFGPALGTSLSSTMEQYRGLDYAELPKSLSVTGYTPVIDLSAYNFNTSGEASAVPTSYTPYFSSYIGEDQVSQGINPILYNRGLEGLAIAPNIGSNKSPQGLLGGVDTIGKFDKTIPMMLTAPDNPVRFEPGKGWVQDTGEYTFTDATGGQEQRIISTGTGTEGMSGVTPSEFTSPGSRQFVGPGSKQFVAPGEGISSSPVSGTRSSTSSSTSAASKAGTKSSTSSATKSATSSGTKSATSATTASAQSIQSAMSTGTASAVSVSTGVSVDVSPLISPAIKPVVKPKLKDKLKEDTKVKSPKLPKRKPKVRGKDKDKKVDEKYKAANIKGAVAWKQDDVTGVYVIWYPPYNLETLDYALQIPGGVKRVKTIQTAWRWIHNRGGEVPEDSLREVALLAKSSAPSPASTLDDILGGEGKLILK